MLIGLVLSGSRLVATRHDMATGTTTRYPVGPDGLSSTVVRWWTCCPRCRSLRDSHQRIAKLARSIRVRILGACLTALVDP